MCADISNEDIEIILDFVRESRDMIEQLEPTIVELGNSCRGGNCWEILVCGEAGCPRHGKALEFPCWLHMGYLGTGQRSCCFADAEAGCLACGVFRATNGDVETMNAIFRLFHSMKGCSGFLNLLQISTTAHAAENLLDAIRSGRIKMEPVHVDLLCRACDFAKGALDYVEANYNDEGLADEAGEVTASLRQAIDEAQDKAAALPGGQGQMVAGQAAEAPSAEEEETIVQQAVAAPSPEEAKAIVLEQAEAPAVEEEEAIAQEAVAAVEAPQPAAVAPQEFEIAITREMIDAFVMEADELLTAFEQGLLQWQQSLDDTEIIRSLFRNIHSFKGNCGFFRYADLERLSHAMETVLDIVKSGTKVNDGGPADLLLALTDILKSGLADVSRSGDGRLPEIESHLGELRELGASLQNQQHPVAHDVGIIELRPLKKAQGPAKPVPAPPPPKPAAVSPAAKATATPRAQEAAGGSAQNGGGAGLQRQDIRVDLAKLDTLINLIGELVIAENMVIHNPDLDGLALENFIKAGQHMGKIIRDLQEVAMIIRMLPVSGLFRRMIRLVHDISAKAGKKVDLHLAGEETELDKTVIETITDPLVHLLRNSLDHGLEPPEERRAAGKPEKGVIRLSACHEEGEVWITIEDDGRGLRREKLLNKAIEKGLVQGDGSEMSDREVYNLIFLPGFSTAEKVTDISGRGVGMDVVRQNLEKIKGKIEITSRPGQGTRVNLRIPLTLAIIDGMLVRVGSTKCILPLLAIREIFCPDPQAITVTPDGLELVKVRGEFFPILRLQGIINDEAASGGPRDGVLILVEHQNRRVCFLASEILGQQQTVIKGLSEYLGEVRCASGCTIMGNGEVCLILDVGGLADLAESRESRLAA